MVKLFIASNDKRYTCIVPVMLKGDMSDLLISYLSAIY